MSSLFSYLDSSNKHRSDRFRWYLLLWFSLSS